MTKLLLMMLPACLAAATAIGLAVDSYLKQHEQRRQKAQLISRVQAGASQPAPSAKLAALAGQSLLAKLKSPAAKLRQAAVSQTEQQLLYDSQLAVLLDVTALGMRAGMAFDQAFELALRRSPGELAELCLAKLEIWQKGLISREQGLHELEDQVKTTAFSRFVALVLRALRYGAPMTQLLLALSAETRRDIRNRREEQVAKAPVKMLIPTGALILPAMLLLVLGPILLDLTNKM